MRRQRHSYWVCLLLSVAGALATAFTYIAVTYLSLPPHDLAAGSGLLNLVADPFVIAIGLPIVAIAGLAASPVAYFCLRERRLSVAIPVVILTAVISVALTVPHLGPAAIIVAFGGTIAACLFCAFAPVSSLRAT